MLLIVFSIKVVAKSGELIEMSLLRIKKESPFEYSFGVGTMASKNPISCNKIKIVFIVKG